MLLHTNGMDLFYEVEGAGEPLLWLHGGLGIGTDWKYIFSSPPAGYRLIAPDQRGHGRSTGARATYSFQQAARDALALLDHLEVGRVKVIGMSGGGITALHMAIGEPARVTAMVVVSAPPRFPEQARAIQRGMLEANVSEADLTRMRERHRREGQLETLFAQTRAMADAGDPDFTPQQLQTITADTLIVFGDRDFLYPVSIAVELRESIPRSWLWVVPNGGQGPVFGAEAPLFEKTALSFLGGAFTARER